MKSTVLMLVVALLAGQVVAAVVYSDSFESYAVGSKAGGDWDNWYSSNKVTSVTAKTGSQSVNITQGGILGRDAVPFVSQGKVDLSFKENEGYLQFFMYITNAESEIYTKLLVSYWSGILNSTTAGYQFPAVVPGSGGVALGVWNDLSVEFDLAAKKQNIYFNGNLVGSNLPLYNSSVTGTGNQLRIYLQELSAAGNTYVDDWTLSAVPEPATMSLLALGGLALIRRKNS